MSLTVSSPGPRYRALLQLLRTAETLWNASRLFFVRWALSPSQFNVLNLLYDKPDGCTQIELSRNGYECPLDADDRGAPARKPAGY